MKKTIILLGVLLMFASFGFADDVTIDQNGNITMGSSNTDANLEVTGSSGEHGILGQSSGTGAAGVYGVNGSNYGILGYDNYGVYGESLGGYAGYFQGNAFITGTLTVGTLLGYTESDPVFLGSPAFGITSGQITNWDAAYGWGDHSGAGYDATNDSWTGTGNVYTTSGNVGIGTTNPAIDLAIGDTDTGLQQQGDGMLSLYTNNVERIRVDTAGKVGIGTPIPAYKLDVRGNRIQLLEDVTGDWIALRTDGLSLDFEFRGAPLYVQSTTAGDHILLNPNSGNNVGIGTESPNGPLHIQSSLNINADGNFSNGIAPLLVGDGDGTGVTLLIDGNQIEQTDASNSLYLNYNSPSGIALAIGGGNVGIGTQNPGQKLTVAGTVESTSGGFKFPDGTVQATAMTATPEWNTRVRTSNKYHQVDVNLGTAISNSITIGADGFPVIAYRDTDNFNIKVAKCSNVGCTGPFNIEIVDSSASQVGTPDIAMDRWDNPIIAYSKSGALQVAICGNASCSVVNQVVEVDSDGGDPSMMINGMNPAIAYIKGAAGDLTFLRCVSNCTDTVYNVIRTLDLSYKTSPSLAITPNGLPVIAYVDNTSSSILKVFKCGDEFCSTNNSIRTLDTNSFQNYIKSPSITIGIDGFPIIAYTNQVRLKIAKCKDESCSTYDLYEADTSGNDEQDARITLDYQGLPIIVYDGWDGANQSLKTLKCSDISCSSGYIIHQHTSGSNVGYQSIAMGVDGLPVGTYWRGTSLRMFKCENPFCVNNWTRR